MLNMEWNEIIERLKRRQAEIMAMASDAAWQDGRKVTAYVVYRQGAIGEENSMEFPFVIAQIPGARSDLEREIVSSGKDVVLEAKFFEGRDFGSIRGRIGPDSVRFLKRYEDSSDLDVVLYEGRRSSNNVYVGKWGFGSGSVDMEISGPFRMILDINAPL